MDVIYRSAIKFAAPALLGAALLMTGQVTVAQNAPAPTKEEAEGIIFERQQIMDQLDSKAEALGNIAAGFEEEEAMPAITREIANLAKQSRASFESNIPGGRAKAEVWTNSADFKMRMDNWVAAAEKMAKIAETGNKNAVISVMGEALPCKQCHDIYRTPPKPKS